MIQMCQTATSQVNEVSVVHGFDMVFASISFSTVFKNLVCLMHLNLSLERNPIKEKTREEGIQLFEETIIKLIRYLQEFVVLRECLLKYLFFTVVQAVQTVEKIYLCALKLDYCIHRLCHFNPFGKKTLFTIWVTPEPTCTLLSFPLSSDKNKLEFPLKAKTLLLYISINSFSNGGMLRCTKFTSVFYVGRQGAAAFFIILCLKVKAFLLVEMLGLLWRHAAISFFALI